jgi:hypothetical protein
VTSIPAIRGVIRRRILVNYRVEPRAFGGRFFPGAYHHSRFTVTDQDGRLSIEVSSDDGGGNVEIEASEADTFPVTSVFGSLADASRFFEEGSVGYSARRHDDRLDGLLLLTESRVVQPLAIHRARSTFFERIEASAPGSVSLDNALIMRDVPHEWQALAQVDADGS